MKKQDTTDKHQKYVTNQFNDCQFAGLLSYRIAQLSANSRTAIWASYYEVTWSHWLITMYTHNILIIQ